MPNQVDITPATNPALGIHFHGPAGQSANLDSDGSNPADYPAVGSRASNNSQGKAVQVTVQGTPGQAVRFSNPS
jgi:hypothetical protein